MSEREELGFLTKSYLMIRSPMKAFEVLREQGDYFGILVYGGLVVLLLCVTEYVRYSKVLNCLSAIFGGDVSETTRGIIMTNILPMTFLILLTLGGYFLLLIAIVYGFNRLIFKKTTRFMTLITAVGYMQFYMIIFIAVTLMVALIMPPIRNVTVYPGTYGVIGSLIRDYAMLPETRLFVTIGQVISRLGYLAMTMLFISSLRQLTRNSWREIAIIGATLLPIYFVIWGGF